MSCFTSKATCVAGCGECSLKSVSYWCCTTVQIGPNILVIVLPVIGGVLFIIAVVSCALNCNNQAKRRRLYEIKKKELVGESLAHGDDMSVLNTSHPLNQTGLIFQRNERPNDSNLDLTQSQRLIFVSEKRNRSHQSKKQTQYKQHPLTQSSSDISQNSSILAHTPRRPAPLSTINTISLSNKNILKDIVPL